MRRRESDHRRFVRLCNELLRGVISYPEWEREFNEIKERQKLQEDRANLKKLLREIDAKFGKGRHPMVQGGLPELGKKR